MQAPTAPLAGRYRFKSAIQAALKAPTWLAVDEQTGREVVASALAPARVAALLGVIGLQHPNLAAILQVVETPDPAALPESTPEGTSVVVAEHVSGRTLHQYLKATRMTPAEAVTLWIRLCRAAGALHASGGAHGAISPRSILVETRGDRPAPVLTQLLAATSGAYCAPERLQGRGPSSTDDTWAIHAALFAALTGSAPYRGETKDQLLQSIVSGQLKKLSDLGIADETLQELLQAGLVANLARRRTTVDQLTEALENWEPAPLSNRVAEWEEDPSTVVADDSESMAAAMRVEQRPGESLPPVPVGEEEQHAKIAEPPRAQKHARPAKPAAIPRPGAGAVATGPEPAPAPAPAPPLEPPAPLWTPAPVERTEPLATEPAATEPEQPMPAAYPEPNPYDDEDDATTIMGGEPLANIRAVLGDSDEPPPAPRPAAGSFPQSPFDQTPPPPPNPYALGAPPSPYAGGAPAQPAWGQPHAGYGAPEPAAYPRAADQGPYLPSVPAPPMDPRLDPGAIDESEIRKASRGPMIALGVIVLVLALLIGVLLFLNYRGVITLTPAPPDGAALARR